MNTRVKILATAIVFLCAAAVAQIAQIPPTIVSSLTGNMLFLPDATYSIGPSGANRPLDIFAARDIAAARNLFSANTSGANGWYIIGGRSKMGSLADGSMTFSNQAGTSSIAIRWGSGAPESSVTGSVGDLYLRTDGGAGTTLCVKESGSATNTGWVCK